MIRAVFFALIALMISVLPKPAFSQVSDAEVIREMKSPGVISVKLTKKKGHKQWSSDYGTWEYVRGVEVIREYPKKKGVTLKIVGDAVYQMYGSKYKYWKFRVISNEYLGMGTPSSQEILQLVQNNMEKFVSNYWYNKIIGDIKALYISEDPQFVWHSTNSMSLNMVAEFRALVNNTDLEDIQQTYEVRLYRDSDDQPWKGFLAIRRSRKTSNRKSYRPDEIRAMKTLADVDRERKAQAAASNLPKVFVAQFKSGTDLVFALNRELHKRTPESVEAFLMKTLAPQFFVRGSMVGLNQRGADIINNNVANAFNRQSKFRDQYCQTPSIDKRRSSKNRIYLKSIGGRVASQIAFTQTSGGYVDGVKRPGAWKITDLYIGVSQKPDDIAFFDSFSSPKKACPND